MFRPATGGTCPGPRLPRLKRYGQWPPEYVSNSRETESAPTERSASLPTDLTILKARMRAIDDPRLEVRLTRICQPRPGLRLMQTPALRHLVLAELDHRKSLRLKSGVPIALHQSMGTIDKWNCRGGVLHLTPTLRRKMKKDQSRIMNELSPNTSCDKTGRSRNSKVASCLT